MLNKSIFVTVGTTCFDGLMEIIDTQSFHKTVKKLGFTSLVIQLGRGQLLPRGLGVQGRFRSLCLQSIQNASDSNNEKNLLNVSIYRYKSNIIEDIETADLIIGHAGAGTILETLRLNKQLIVVVNEALMNNHQWELAKVLEDKGYLITATPSTLIQKLESFEPSKFNPWLLADTTSLYSVIQALTGLDISKSEKATEVKKNNI